MLFFHRNLLKTKTRVTAAQSPRFVASGLAHFLHLLASSTAWQLKLVLM